MAVSCRNLLKTYGTLAALNDVSLAIRPNEFFTLLGPSGCGKTTLLRAIAGFVSLDGGSITVHGQRLDGLPPHKRPVNTVFQSYAVFPHMTVADNIAFGLEMERWPKRRITTRVEEMLRLVQLDGMAARKPAQLSGGQQQRVAVARALAKGPRVLLLDEPLSALDQKLRTGMQLELKRLQRETGITFVFVTHDQREALTMSDRIAVMNAGNVLQIGSPEEIYERPAARFVADFIGEMNFIPAEAAGGCRYRLATGLELDASEPASTGTPVTLAIRPERLRLGPISADSLAATVQETVYEGTDTIYYLAMTNGDRLRAREQNRSGSLPQFGVGDKVGLTLPACSIRVLTA
ncbi:spermidine/putrescine ABC transporter ATP-binding protein [Aliidongia dinghuensis]|uniref:Spermidine/putrescine import ATP-binding protein PotA n=1 Tax=Aliidongia dinghuensis TaxID=1867774 RepID=A0A8J2YZ24_9PROT|nr:spermidine/putrescine ABC transporter ATP-binding protein [Aliidongia dinghuensis]